MGGPGDEVRHGQGRGGIDLAPWTIPAPATESVLVRQPYRRNESRWFDGQDVAIHVIERSLGGVADEQSRYPDTRQSAHHDQIDPFATRHCRNDLAGEPFLHMNPLAGHRVCFQKRLQSFPVQSDDCVSVLIDVDIGGK